MAVSQGSGEFLRGISALIQDKKQQRQSEQSMALTSLMFNLKREDAEKQRVTNVLGDAQKQIQDLSKTIEEKKVVFGQLGGSQEALKSINSGIKTDAGSILGATMSRMAGDVGGMQKSLESLKQLESQYRVAGDELDKRIGAYSYGAGVAAQRAFKEKGSGGIVTKEEIGELFDDKDGKMTEFKKKIEDEYGKGIVDWSIFQSGFYKGLSGEEKRAAEMSKERATASYYRGDRGKGRDYTLPDVVNSYKEIYGKKIELIEGQIKALAGEVDKFGDPIPGNDEKISVLNKRLNKVLKQGEEFMTKNAKGMLVFPDDPDVKLREDAIAYIKENNKSKTKQSIEETEANIQYVMDKLRK